MFQVCGNDLIQTSGTVKVKVVCATHQMHSEDQTHQAKVMIAVQVRDENMVDAMKVRLKAHKLHLRSFPAIHQKETILNFHELRGRKSPISRQRTART